MTHATLRPEFENLIDPYAPVGQVGTGFDFTEGPIGRAGQRCGAAGLWRRGASLL